MNCRESLLYCMFSCMSNMGLRSFVFDNMLFNPPTISYILRPLQGEEVQGSMFNNINDSSIMQSTKILTSEIYKYRQQSQQDSTNNLLSPSNRLYSVDYRKKSNKTESRAHLNLLQSDIKPKPSNRNLIGERGRINSGVKLGLYSIGNNGKMYERHYKPRNKHQYPPHQFMLISIEDVPVEVEPEEDLNIVSYLLETRNNNVISSLFVEIRHTKVRNVILYSHGNSSDLGQNFESYLDLAHNLNINVFAYEYSGYGQSTGRCSDINSIVDIQAAYDFLVYELEFSPSCIYLYGFSLGSGPSITLVLDIHTILQASSPQYETAGLIIHSGILSGLRVFKPSLPITPYYDVFPNIDLIRYVRCPTLIIHGTNDSEVSCVHGRDLANHCSSLYLLWMAVDGGHGNIDSDERWRNQYITILRKYFNDMETLMNESNNGFMRESKRAVISQPLEHLYGDEFDWVG